MDKPLLSIYLRNNESGLSWIEPIKPSTNDILICTSKISFPNKRINRYWYLQHKIIYVKYNRTGNCFVAYKR